MDLIRRVAALAVLTLAVSGCGTPDTRPPPDCPFVGILDDADSVRVFSDGGERTRGDVAYDAELTRANLIKCEWRGDKVVSKVRYEFAAQIGPGARSSKYSLPYFVALSDPQGKLLAKDVFAKEINFGSDKLVVRGGHEIEDIYVTPPEGDTGLGYEILLGIQLTREQLEHNRGQAGPQPLDLFR